MIRSQVSCAGACESQPHKARKADCAVRCLVWFVIGSITVPFSSCKNKVEINVAEGIDQANALCFIVIDEARNSRQCPRQARCRTPLHHRDPSWLLAPPPH